MAGTSTELARMPLSIAALQQGYREDRFTPADVVREVYRRIRDWADDAVWSHLLDEPVALARAEALGRLPRSDRGPLHGIPFSVKDNIDVAGFTTTCGCAGLARQPEVSALAVAKCEAQGAVLVGKNTLDQFATGLNGTRTMGPHCRNALEPAYVPGGSSSGSGVAVAAGLVAFSLGTDTGGSGRVPAAMNNIVGLKPTLGLVGTSGLVYNSRYFDTVPVFARTVGDAYTVLECIRGEDPQDAFSRAEAGNVPLRIPLGDRFRFGVPREDQLAFFGDNAAGAAFARAVETLQRIGGRPVTVDYGIFLEAGRLPFDSGLLAERAASYADVVAARPETVHPAVAAMIAKGLAYTGTDTVRALWRMMELRSAARAVFRDIDVLATPTVARMYRCEEMLAEPIVRNNHMGYYTYPMSPLDLCALAVPASVRPDGLPFSLQLIAAPLHDGLLRAVGERFAAEARVPPGTDVLR